MMKTKSKSSALVTILAATCLLTGCAGGLSADRAGLVIYQPRILSLKAGIPIQAKEGIYTPQMDEVWHSAAEYQALEDQITDAAAARAQRKNSTSK